MPITINGLPHRLLKEVASAIGVSRTTIWRWRQRGEIPAGGVFRRRWVVFTPEEFEKIKVHANRVEPASLLRRPAHSAVAHPRGAAGTGQRAAATG